MLEQRSVVERNDTFRVPEGASDQPSTWLPISYGNTSEGLPLATVRVAVVDANDAGRGIPDVRVLLQSRNHSVIYADQRTDASGRLSMPRGDHTFPGFWKVPVGVSDNLRVRIELPPGYLAEEPVFSHLPGGEEAVPMDPRPTTLADYEGCDRGSCELKGITFRVNPPAGPIAVGSLNQDRAWATTEVRGGPDPRVVAPPSVVLSGENFHDRMEVYLSKASCPTNPGASGGGCEEGTHFFRVTDFSVLPGGTGLEFRVPDIPARRFGSYVVQVHDVWTRPGVVPSSPSSWKRSETGLFVGEPPYELIHGFSFYNTGDESSYQEMTAVHGEAFFDPVTGCIPLPHYALLWFPVYFDLASGTGSCFGMAGTSRLFAEGSLSASDFDPAARFANGLQGTSTPVGEPPREVLRAPRPGHWRPWGEACLTRYVPNNFWAKVRRGHGAQFSDEAISALLPQLLTTGADGTSFDRVSWEDAADYSVIHVYGFDREGQKERGLSIGEHGARWGGWLSL